MYAAIRQHKILTEDDIADLQKQFSQNTLTLVKGTKTDDLNDMKDNSLVYYDSGIMTTVQNLPPNFKSNYGLVLNLSPSSDIARWWGLQIVFDFDGNQVFLRFRSNTQWKVWQKSPFQALN